MIIYTSEEITRVGTIKRRVGQRLGEIKTRPDSKARRTAITATMNDYHNDLDKIKEPAQKRTLEKMTTEEIYNDAIATVYYWATHDYPESGTFEPTVKGIVDSEVLQHLDALRDAGEYEKEQHIIDLVDQKKANTLDPEIVDKYKKYEIYRLEKSHGK